MTLPTPPRYVVLPEEVIEQAYAPDKPRRALLASFTRILSLAWESKYQHTPPLNVDELMEFLKLSRRQYFEQIADMELLGWLRSSHPAPGFVRFSFSRSISEQVSAQEPGAENRTASAENRTASAENRTELKRIEEEESIEFKKQESSSSSSLKQNEVRKTALTAGGAKMQLLLENLHLLFEPEIHGVLEIKPVYLAGIPERVLAWIAKAYQERARLDAPIGLIVKHLLERDEPNRYYLNSYLKILPEPYLEQVGEIEYSCAHCDKRFDKRALIDKHTRADHCICTECGQDFPGNDERAAHYKAAHDPYRVTLKTDSKDMIKAPVLDGTVETLWVNILSQLQMEMPRASFDTWVRDTQPVRYDGNVLEVSTRNSYACDWLTSRLTETVQQLLTETIGKPITVRFIVASDSQMVTIEEDT